MYVQTVLRHVSNALASDSSKSQRSIDEQLLELQFDEILALTRTLFVHMLRLLRVARVCSCADIILHLCKHFSVPPNYVSVIRLASTISLYLLLINLLSGRSIMRRSDP